MSAISSSPPADLVSTLDTPNPTTSLQSLSLSSQQIAASLAEELSSLLHTNNNKQRHEDNESKYPIPLPKLLKDTSKPGHPLTSATLASESILNSLTKIATGGSSASREMKSLESERRTIDEEADDISLALRVREGVEKAASAMNGRRYPDAASNVRDVNVILKHSGQRVREIAGEGVIKTHMRTEEILKRGIAVAYESAVQQADLKSLSELTPLLGMIDMADLGVRMYLSYSKSQLEKEMNPIHAEDEAKRSAQQNTPQKLAKIFNAAVTHLRHHLPMVAYSLGEADGDVALVQLANVEVESRVVNLLKGALEEKELGLTVKRADRVAAMIEERYTSGGEGFSVEDGNMALANVLMGLGVGDMGGVSVDISKKRNAALQDDCGFTIEVGNLADVDAALEQWALMLQHTESYERFLRHVVDEVTKARKMRFEQKQEEKRKMKMKEDAKKGDAGNLSDSCIRKSISGSVSSDNMKEEDEQLPIIEILPAHTQLNEIAAEVGGYYSSLERCLLLVGIQRAFISSHFPDESTFTTVATNAIHGTGSKALQTILVEECLYAARRSTLRAFATGHTGTASAAANACVDVLGRILLEVLSHRAEIGASLLKPGEGLLAGQHGLGQAALSFAKSTAGKGLRGVQGAAALAGASKGIVGDEEAEASLKLRTMLGVARAAAHFNDLEIVADYTTKLESHFLKEIDAGYPRDHETEQLRMCIKGLESVVDAFSHASRRSIELLVSVLLPRVRQIVNNAVGPDGRNTTATTSNFLGSPVLKGGATAVTATYLNYDLNEAAFDLSQMSEGYMSHMCAELDEVLDPLRVHLVPKISDEIIIGVLGAVAKRLEAAIRKSKFTPLGAISLDSDVRYLMSFAKDRIDTTELKSTVSLCKSCPPLGRLNQIALLLNVDDLEDALDLISVNKRKGNWDLKMDDAKTLLTMRVDFEGSKVNDLLKVDES